MFDMTTIEEYQQQAQTPKGKERMIDYKIKYASIRKGNPRPTDDQIFRAMRMFEIFGSGPYPLDFEEKLPAVLVKNLMDCIAMTISKDEEKEKTNG